MRGAQVVSGIDESAYKYTPSKPFMFPFIPYVAGTGLEQGAVTIPANTVKTLVVFRAKELIEAVSNKYKGIMLEWGNTVDPPALGEGQMLFQVIANPVFTGTPNFVDISVDSVFEYDHTIDTGASAIYAGGGKVLLHSHVFYSSSQGVRPQGTSVNEISAEQLGLIGRAGDYFAVIAKNRGSVSAVARTSLTWVEKV